MRTKINMLMALALLLCIALPTIAQHTRTSVSAKDNEWVMNRAEDGREFHVKIKGKIEFTDDYSDIKMMPPGSSLRIEDKFHSLTRKLEIIADATGQPRRSYFVQGAAHDFDAEARQWLSEMMLEAVRQCGYDAERRVARLYERGGAQAVLAEVSLIKNDYTKRIYLRELMTNHRLDAASARRVVQVVAREMSSAYEKRQTLSLVAEKYLDDQQTLSEFNAAVATIDSDYERGQTLAAMMKRGSLTSEQLKGLLPTVAGISSDYEKAQALIRIVKSYPAEVAALPAFFDAANSIDSAYEKARVLLTLLTAKPSGEALKLTLASAARISADYEKARVLIQIAALIKDDETRRALVEAARSIGSEYERGRVLSAAFR